MNGGGLPEAMVNTCDKKMVLGIDLGGPTVLASHEVPIVGGFGAPENGSVGFDFRGWGVDWLAFDHKDARLFASFDGEMLWRLQKDYMESAVTPVIADVDNDGSADVILLDRHLGTVRVFEDPERRPNVARRIWNQWNYAADSVREDATIPAQPKMPWQGSGTSRVQTRRACAERVPLPVR